MIDQTEEYTTLQEDNYIMSHEIEPNTSLTLLIVVLNYRTPNLTIDCLRSLVDEVQWRPGIRVVVSDNASGDGSVEQIDRAIKTEGWHEWVSLMPLERNGGFAFGNNAPVRKALASTNPPRYILLLNPDTIVHPGAIGALVEFMDSHPRVGIAGSRLENPDGTPQRSAFRFHTVLSELDGGLRLGIVSQLLEKWVVAPPVPEASTQTDWVSGASIIVRREVFEQVGLLDEEYFMYYEETDFCWRALTAGWSCWYVPQSRIIHFVGQSSGVHAPNIAPKRLPQYWFDSRRRYFLKNYGWLSAFLADTAWILGYLLWLLRRVVQGKPDNDPPYLLQDFLRNSVFRGNGLTSNFLKG
jgi:GT2 family glycosyltransferase